LSDNIKNLARLAMEVDITDPIDWGMLSVKEHDAYELMANSVIQMMESTPPQNKEVVMMATITKLLVENFVLNLKLDGIDKKGK
jgi:hypothetical protein